MRLVIRVIKKSCFKKIYNKESLLILLWQKEKGRGFFLEKVILRYDLTNNHSKDFTVSSIQFMLNTYCLLVSRSYRYKLWICVCAHDRKMWKIMLKQNNVWQSMEEGRLARPRGMVWGGKREEGSGWGTHVYLWWIHFDIWQN